LIIIWFTVRAMTTRHAASGFCVGLVITLLVVSLLSGERSPPPSSPSTEAISVVTEEPAEVPDPNSPTDTTANQSSRCFEYYRSHELPGDSIYRVPCVPQETPGLAGVQHAPFGMIARFHHRPWQDSATADALQLKEPASAVPRVRVAVEMSGHMRTYRKCAASARANLLDSTGGLLFLATYPDLGDKRFGVRFQEQDAAVDLSELRSLYGADHLAAMYLVDLPAARVRLARGFPTLFVVKQWSWMIYQLFMMEVAHNLTLNHVGLLGLDDSFGGQKYFAHSVNVSGLGNPGLSWGGFDIYIRVRPDLYILGQLRFERPVHAGNSSNNSNKISFMFSCGGNEYPTFDLNPTDVFRTTHHPIWLWVKDPLSDHSAIGQPAAMDKFLRLFSDTVFRDPRAQERRVFPHGQTAERLWGEHAERQGLIVRRVPGWHIMLRNAAKFSNATLYASEFKRKLISLVFGVTDARAVGCPSRDNCVSILTHKPRKIKTGSGTKRSVTKLPPGFTGKDCVKEGG
jgi:hypothetical protein